MSVICKVYVNSVSDFGENKLIKTNCIVENEVMAAYNPEDEDKLFTKYSPSGSADFVIPKHIPISMAAIGQTKLYLMFVKEADPALSKAIAYAQVSVKSITDFGGTSKVFEISNIYNGGKPGRDHRHIQQFSHRITIDNPGASDQFNAGDAGWWVGIYSAEALTMKEVIQDAHA